MNALALRVAAGHYAWLERRLFEVLGGWVPSVPEPEVKLLLREQSHQHAGHAGLWDALCQPPAPAAGVGSKVAAVLDEMAAPEGTAERLAGAYRVVLPRLLDAYRAMADAAAPASDGPLARALGLMLADDVRALEDAERLIGDLGAEAAGAHQRRVEALLAEIGGVEPPEHAWTAARYNELSGGLDQAGMLQGDSTQARPG